MSNRQLTPMQYTTRVVRPDGKRITTQGPAASSTAALVAAGDRYGWGNRISVRPTTPREPGK